MPTTTMPLLPPEAAGSLQSTTNTLDFLHRHARPPQEGCFNRSRWYDFVTNRVEKKLPFGRQAASVLVEAFNIFNRSNVANVNAVSGPSFGTPVAYLPGREVQFGIRYFFGPQ